MDLMIKIATIYCVLGAKHYSGALYLCPFYLLTNLIFEIALYLIYTHIYYIYKHITYVCV